MDEHRGRYYSSVGHYHDADIPTSGEYASDIYPSSSFAHGKVIQARRRIIAFVSRV